MLIILLFCFLIWMFFWMILYASKDEGEELREIDPSLDYLLAIKPVDVSQESILTRKIENIPGTKPNATEAMDAMECPNCGAINMVGGSAGECEYCGSHLTAMKKKHS